MNKIVQPPINRRQLNVMVMLFSFLLLPFSGIIIHSTHGIAEREPFRHFAMSIHNISAIIFLSTCVLHVVANRKALAKYISNKTTEYFSLKREVIIAFVIVIGIVGLFASHAFHVK
jgi:hypothetical protein